MKRPRLGVFGGTLSVFVAATLFVRFIFPSLAQHLVGHHAPLPVPQTLQLWWLVLLVATLAVYVTSSTRTTQEFMAPIRAAVRGESARWQHNVARAVALLAPLSLGAWTFVDSLPQTRPAALTRQQHPGTSGPSAAPYVGLSNPFRGATPAQTNAAIVRGRGLYFRDCAPCHGAKHDGDGPEARAQSLRPVSFRDPGTIAVLVENAAFWRVNEGAAGLPPVSTPWDSAMPAWHDDLPADDLWRIVLSEYEDSGMQPRVTGMQ
ncbi:MAG TPA: cytochrome c [Polyangiales bacterium]